MKKRILYIAQELSPFVNGTEISEQVLELATFVQNHSDYEVRVFIPRYGCINQRRHQLHEVIRLSGINLVINDIDQPLIIKVGSVQKAKLQVYFIDNDEYFPRRRLFHEEDGSLMSNNDERMLFYCKGVIETVRKLGWKPDVIHCQGWFSSLVPMYIKKLYNNDPLFENVKVIYSVSDNMFKGTLSNSLPEKLLFEDLCHDDVSILDDATIINLHKHAINYSDGVIQSSSDILPEVLDYVKTSGKLFMKYPGRENYEESYRQFYEQFIEEEVVLT